MIPRPPATHYLRVWLGGVVVGFAAAMLAMLAAR